MKTLALLRRRAPAWLALVRRDPRPIGIVLAVGALLLAFEGLARKVSAGETRNLDRAVLEALRAPNASSHSLGSIWTNIAANDFGAMGSVSVLAFTIVMVCGLFLCLKRWREAALLLFASGGGLALTNFLKDLFQRGRPPLSPDVAAGLNASFPSGHAMLSATVYLTLGVVIGAFAKRRLVRLYAVATALLLTALIGVSRIYLGIHWFTDVLGGWCIGVAWALIWWGVAMIWERRSASSDALKTRKRTGGA